MAEEEQNPFVGLTFGRAVDLLRRDPTLAPKFDSIFKDEEEFDTLERARLHQVNSYYRGTVNGASSLNAMQNYVLNPPEAKQTEETEVTKAQDAWAARLAGGVRRGQEFKALTSKDVHADMTKKYESVMDDLANYDRMAPFSNTMEFLAAGAGAIVGSIPTIENVAGLPIRGATVLQKMFMGGAQAAAVNVATDPVIQGINMASKVQGDYDWMQTALAAPIGFVIGGGLVGAGEVVSKAFLKKEMTDLSAKDPSIVPDSEVKSPAATPEVVAPTLPEHVERVTAKPPEPGTSPIERFFESVDPKPPEWTKIGEQKGSNPGGTYKDAKGEDWYVKTPDDPAIVDNELRGNSLYNLAGVDVPVAKTIDLDGKYSTASKILAEPQNWKEYGKIDPDSNVGTKATASIKENFAADAWLANWDVIGLTGDNILVNMATGETVRIDQGGTLTFRAQGLPKPFTDKVTEFETMRNPILAPQAAKIFGEMTNEELIKSIDKLKHINSFSISNALLNSGMKQEDVFPLTQTLNKRLEHLRAIQKELKAEASAAGLPMDEASRKARAKKMGFDVDKVWYHGTGATFAEFKISQHKSEKAVFLTDALHGAKEYGSKILKLYSRAKDIEVVEYNKHYNSYEFKTIINKAIADGKDAVLFKNVSDIGGKYDQFAVLKPNLLRSVNAAFNPKQKASKKLAALEEPKTLAMEEPKAPTAEEPKDFDGQYKELYDSAAEDDMQLTRLAAETVEKVEAGKTVAIHKTPLQGELVPNPNYLRPPDKVMSLHQMVHGLVEAFGDAIRQSPQKKGQLGTYNPDTGIIRVNEFADFQVSAHEVAHSIAAKLGDVHLTGTSDLATIAKNADVELKGLDYNQDPVDGQRVYEGFAEFVRLFMTNPAHAQKKAPQFFSEFTNLLEAKHPDYLAKLTDFQTAYRNYLDATPEQITMAGIVVPEQTFGDKIVARFTDAKVAPTVRNIMALFYDATVNKTEDFNRATRALGLAIKEQLGGKYIDLLPSEDPRVHLRMLQKSSQTAMAQVRDGIKNYLTGVSEGDSITQAINYALGKSFLTGGWDSDGYKKFSAYLKARRAVHLWDRYDSGELPNPPVVESKAYLEAVITQFDGQHPTFRKASDMIHEINRRILQRMTDSGAFHKLTPEAQRRIIDSEPFYVPFQRDRSDIVPGKGGTNLPAAGVQNIRGSMRDVIDPITSMMNHLMRMEQTIAHAEVMRSLAGLAKKAGPMGGKFLEPRPAHEVKRIEFDLETAFRRALEKEGGQSKQQADITAQTVFDDLFGDTNITGVTFKQVTISGKKEPTIIWSEHGQLKAARIASKEDFGGNGYGLYEIMNAAPKPIADLMTQMAQAVSSTLTYSITSHPIYAIRNIFRDQFAAQAFVPGYIPAYHALKGFGRVIKDNFGFHDEYAKAYRQFGGVNPAGQIIPAYADAVASDIKALSSQGFSVKKVFTLKGLAEVVTAAEMATRLGALEVLYKQKKRSGLSDYDAWLSSVNETADLLPFDRYGSLVGRTRTVVPFLNPWIQSMDKARRVLLTPVGRSMMEQINGTGHAFKAESDDLRKAAWAWMSLGITGFGFGMGYAALMEGRKGYEDASGRVKATNVVVPVGDDQVFLLPKPWELAMGFTAGEYAYAALKRDDPRAAGQLVEAMKETMSSPNLLFGNPLVGTTFQAMANYNQFTGGPIVSSELAKLEPEYQFDASTGYLAKEVGKITGWSPKKVQFVLSGYGGYWGRDLAQMGAGNQDEDVTSNLEDITLNRMGIRDAAGLSDAREKFWKHMGRNTGSYGSALDTYKRLVSSPNTEAQAMEFLRKLPENKQAWIVLDQAAHENGKAVFKEDDKRAHPLKRAHDAVTEVDKLKRTISNNMAVDASDKTALVVNPEIRKKVVRTLSTLAVAEMTNALTIIHEPGYDKRALIDVDIYLEQLRSVAPNVAEELVNRYATKKVYKADSIARIYDRMSAELVARGSEADIREWTSDVRLDGYEFDADSRRKRTPARRVPIGGR